MKLALSSAIEAPQSAPILLRGNVLESMQRAAELGYGAIELHIREDALLNRKQILHMSEELNVKISAVVTGRLATEGQCDLMNDIPYVASAAKEGLRRYIEIAHELKSDVIIGWLKGRIPPEGQRKRYCDRLAASLMSVLDEAQRGGVRLLIEVINRYETNMFNTGGELCQFIADYQLEGCFVHLDSFHMNIEESNPVTTIHATGKQLGYFHLADNQRRYPGSGCIDFRSIFEALRAIDYQGYLSVECLPEPDADTAARLALNQIVSLMNQ